jgi:SynChlorMet cassette protein ScmC
LEKENYYSMDGYPSQLCYRMEFEGGLSWGLAASPSASSWLHKIADMLHLDGDPLDCEHKVIFTIKENDGRSQYFISEKGWKDLSIPPVFVHYKDDESLAIFELGKKDYELIDPVWLLYFSCYIYDRAQKRGGLPLHAALMEKDDSGFAIIAPSGTGKSTCSKRIQSPWKSLCDDECLIVRDNAGLYYSHPFPTWSILLGKEAEGIEKRWNVQRGLPLKGIFILEQSLHDEVVPIGQAEAAVHIYQSACQTCPKIWSHYSPEEERASKKLLFENACLMSKSVPAFILRASLTGKFWEQMEKAIMTV